MCSLRRARRLAVIGVALALGGAVVGVPVEAVHAQQEEAPVEPPVVRPVEPDLYDRGFEQQPAGGREEIGQTIGDEVTNLTMPLLLSVALIVGLGALAKRDLSQTLVIFAVVLAVGGFVLAPTAVRDLVESLADSFSPGGAG